MSDTVEKAAEGDGIEEAAKYLASTVMLYAWEGLRSDGRASDDGYPAWTVGGHWNARQEDYRDVVREIVRLAALSARPAQEQGEWVVVPKEATTRMSVAGHDAIEKHLTHTVHTPMSVDCWRAMLAAAPKPSETGE